MEIKILNSELPNAAPKEDAQFSAAELEETKETLLSVMQKGYASQNYLRIIYVAPNLIETINMWIAEFELPSIAKTMLSVEPGDPDVMVTGIVQQVEIENGWLQKHFADHPIMTVLKNDRSPMLLSYGDFKMLYLLEMWDLAKEAASSKIWKP